MDHILRNDVSELFLVQGFFLVGIIMITFMIGLICNEKCMKEAII